MPEVIDVFSSIIFVFHGYIFNILYIYTHVLPAEKWPYFCYFCNDQRARLRGPVIVPFCCCGRWWNALVYSWIIERMIWAYGRHTYSEWWLRTWSQEREGLVGTGRWYWTLCVRAREHWMQTPRGPILMTPDRIL